MQGQPDPEGGPAELEGGDPLALAGAWRAPARFDDFGPGELALRDGCSIYLTRVGDAYAGSTRGGGCASSLAGASYATSEVTIERDVLTSWDRGFDAAGTHVWGAVEGPYVFVRE